MRLRGAEYNGREWFVQMAKAATVTKITTTTTTTNSKNRVSATTIISEWRQVCVAGFILIVLLFCWLF